MQLGTEWFQEAERHAAYLRTTKGRLRAQLGWINLRGSLPVNAHGWRTLDVGGGSGRLASRMAELGFGAVLLGSSEPMLVASSREANARALSGRASFHRGMLFRTCTPWVKISELAVCAALRDSHHSPKFQAGTCSFRPTPVVGRPQGETFGPVANLSTVRPRCQLACGAASCGLQGRGRSLVPAAAALRFTRILGSVMRSLNLLVLPFLLLALAASACAQEQGFDYTPWDRVLKKFVTETGRVDYGALKANPADLTQYVEQIARRSPISDPNGFPTRDSQLAYWINAYNALVMKAVIENWPTKSVRNLGKLYSFFWARKFVVGGMEYTLDNIEDILRKKLVDPRIHFAIVCASNSCPRLQREAYTPENTERLLDEATGSYVNEPRNLKVDVARNRVALPYILGHYHEDFENYVRTYNAGVTGQPQVDYVRLYANPANRALLGQLKNPKVDHFGYDWGINDVNAPVATGKFVDKEATP